MYVGNDYQEYAGGQTALVDLHGEMLVPGFIDNDVHFLDGGYYLANIDLREAKSKAGFIAGFVIIQILPRASNWIRGGNWDHEAWGGELPRATWIDSISGDHPVFISRYDGHMGTRQWDCVKNGRHYQKHEQSVRGEIVRDRKTGQPTGILRDEATNLVSKIITNQTEQELDEVELRCVPCIVTWVYAGT